MMDLSIWSGVLPHCYGVVREDVLKRSQQSLPDLDRSSREKLHDGI